MEHLLLIPLPDLLPHFQQHCAPPQVFKARLKNTLEIVAMKFINKSGRSAKELKLLQEEMKILKRLDHPHIIRMIESFETADEVVVVTEFADGELFQVLEDDRVLPMEEVRCNYACTCSSPLTLHQQNSTHSYRCLPRVFFCLCVSPSPNCLWGFFVVPLMLAPVWVSRRSAAWHSSLCLR